MTLWFSDEIKDKYEKLIVSDVSRYLPGAALSDIPKLEDNDLTGLINSASVFALADNHKKKTIAYEIATRVIELTQSHKGEFTIAAEFILTRLGNFPGRTLLRDRYLDGKGFRLPLYLKLEEIVKEEQNSVCIYND